jgi:hypothetical protein
MAGPDSWAILGYFLLVSLGVEFVSSSPVPNVSDHRRNWGAGFFFLAVGTMVATFVASAQNVSPRAIDALMAFSGVCLCLSACCFGLLRVPGNWRMAVSSSALVIAIVLGMTLFRRSVQARPAITPQAPHELSADDIAKAIAKFLPPTKNQQTSPSVDVGMLLDLVQNTGQQLDFIHHQWFEENERLYTERITAPMFFHDDELRRKLQNNQLATAQMNKDYTDKSRALLRGAERLYQEVTLLKTSKTVTPEESRARETFDKNGANETLSVDDIGAVLHYFLNIVPNQVQRPKGKTAK